MNYLQLNDWSKLGIEELALAEFFGEGNYKTFYKKHIIQNKLKITKDDFIAGDIPTMFAAMRQLGIQYHYEDYPESLRKYLHRNVWTSTMKEVRDRLYDESLDMHSTGLGWFIKPRNKLKRFTGFVCNDISDLWKAEGAGNGTALWCSDIVTWKSEFRCPVVNGKVLGRYVPASKDGTGALPDMQVVQQMADDFENAPKAYCLDVGVLSTGETALIEVNDGFSIGKYDMPKDIYANVLITRWNELKEGVTK